MSEAKTMGKVLVIPCRCDECKGMVLGTYDSNIHFLHFVYDKDGYTVLNISRRAEPLFTQDALDLYLGEGFKAPSW